MKHFITAGCLSGLPRFATDVHGCATLRFLFVRVLLGLPRFLHVYQTGVNRGAIPGQVLSEFSINEIDERKKSYQPCNEGIDIVNSMIGSTVFH